MRTTLKLIALFLLSFNAYGYESPSIRFSSETSEDLATNNDESAVNIALIYNEPSYNSAHKASAGISINTIRSDIPLESAGRNRIYPVYAFMNLALNHAISPFTEFGIDVGDALVDKAFEGNGSDVDFYYSFGVEFTLQRTVSFSIYHKVYNLYFDEIDNPIFRDVIFDVTGVSFSYYMK